MGIASVFLPRVASEERHVAVVGPGEDQMDIRHFLANGRTVTSFDFVPNNITHTQHTFVQGDFCLAAKDYDKRFDAVWACHVLEHQRNVGLFLDAIRSVLKDTGTLYISVPPAKPNIVGGHLTVWNVGLLIYNLCLAGFDMKTASFKKRGYNIFGICKKNKVPLPDLNYDKGDLERLADFWNADFVLTQNINGERADVNWI